MKQATVLAVVKEFPGSTGTQIMDVLRARSRAARYFGEDSIWSTIFGPSFGGMYIALAELERRGEVSSHWGAATEQRGWRRPRHYWPTAAGTT
jgi:hypothetical protein